MCVCEKSHLVKFWDPKGGTETQDNAGLGFWARSYSRFQDWNQEVWKQVSSFLHRLHGHPRVFSASGFGPCIPDMLTLYPAVPPMGSLEGNLGHWYHKWV